MTHIREICSCKWDIFNNQQIQDPVNGEPHPRVGVRWSDFSDQCFHCSPNTNGMSQFCSHVCWVCFHKNTEFFFEKMNISHLQCTLWKETFCLSLTRCGHKASRT